MPTNSVEHGSARFHEAASLPRGAMKEKRPALWLGHPVAENRAAHDRVIWSSVERHLLTIAPTRSGKGTSAIIPNLLTYPGSVFVIDPKGENAWVTAERRREMGQEVFILDPWGEVSKRYGPETSARFNPMAGLDPASPDFTDDLAGLADALIINQGKDPHWDDSARELVAGLIAFLVEDKETRPEASLSQVRELLTLPRSQLVVLVDEAVQRGGVAARKLSRFREETNEIASVISTAVTQTAFLDNAALADAMSASDFTFGRLTEGNVSVFLVLPADKLGPYGRWMRLLITIAIRAIARAPRPQGKVLFLLDEFGTVGKLNAVEQAFGLMGGMGICLWPFVQDLNQLKRDYPDSWETFVANAEAVQAFGVKDNFTSEYLSRLLGVATEETISQKTADKRSGVFGLFAQPGYSSMHDRSFQRSLMFADEIRSMRSDWQLILYRGQASMGALMPYYATSTFNGMYRPLPGMAAKAAAAPRRSPPALPRDALAATLRRSLRTLLVMFTLVLVAAFLTADMKFGSTKIMTARLAAAFIGLFGLAYLSHPLWRRFADGTLFGGLFALVARAVNGATFFLNPLKTRGVVIVVVIIGALLATLFAARRDDRSRVLSPAEYAGVEAQLRTLVTGHFAGTKHIVLHGDTSFELPELGLKVEAHFSPPQKPKEHPRCLVAWATWTQGDGAFGGRHGTWLSPSGMVCANGKGRGLTSGVKAR